MAFAENQVRQLYVVEKENAAPAALGDIAVVDGGDHLLFKYFGRAGLHATDYITKKNVRAVKATLAADMVTKLKAVNVKVAAGVTSFPNGSRVSLTVKILQYGSLSPNNELSMTVSYKVVGTKTNTQVIEGLADLLTKTVNSRGIKYFDITTSGTELTIKDAGQPWTIDKQSTPLMFYVTANYIGDELGDGTPWAEIKDVATGVSVGNGQKAAELERFCLGNRSTSFYGAAHPYISDPKAAIVDPTKEYDFLDISYFFQGSGVHMQASEKVITLVAPKGAIITAIAKKVNDLINPPAVGE